MDLDQTCRNNDSNRIVLLNKNTVLYEEDQVNSQFRNDDQSQWSTPFHPELLQKYKNLRPDQDETSEFSDELLGEEDTSGFDVANFNINDYTYEDQLD